jgi:hypothetical protein
MIHQVHSSFLEPLSIHAKALRVQIHDVKALIMECVKLLIVTSMKTNLGHRVQIHDVKALIMECVKLLIVTSMKTNLGQNPRAKAMAITISKPPISISTKTTKTNLRQNRSLQKFPLYSVVLHCQNLSQNVLTLIDPKKSKTKRLQKDMNL